MTDFFTKTDLSRKDAENIISDTYMAFEIWFTIAAIYMVVIMILSIGASQVERRYTVTN